MKEDDEGNVRRARLVRPKRKIRERKRKNKGRRERPRVA
jgi:hypothetical protein